MILTKVQDFLERATKGEAELSEELIQEFASLCEGAIRRQFSGETREWRLRMSAIGQPVCQQQLSKAGHEEDLDYATKMRFIYGDMVEALAVVIMKGAGLPVEDFQKQVSLKIGDVTVGGTMDLKMFGKVWDVKSASQYAFNNKFGDYGGYHKLKEDDPFGYVIQGHGYAAADDCDFGGWIVVDKSSGKWSVTEAPDIPAEKVEALEKADANIKAILHGEFKKLYPDTPETYKDGTEVIRTGNRLLDKQCGFCGYKKVCWPDAVYHPKISSNAKSKPMAWYSKLVKKER